MSTVKNVVASQTSQSKASLKQFYGCLRAFDPSFFGIAFTQLWFGGILRQAGDYAEGVSLNNVIYCASIVLFCATLVGSRFVSSKTEDKLPRWQCACVLAVATILLSWEGAPQEVYYAAAVLGGVGFGWALLQWGSFFGRADALTTILCLLMAIGVSTILYFAIELLPPLSRPAALVAVAILSTGFARRACRLCVSASRPEVRFDAESISSLWKFFLGAGIFSFVFGYVGSSADIYEGDSAMSVFRSVFTIMLAFAVAYWVFRKPARAGGSKLWVLDLVLVGVALVLLSFPVFEARMFGALLVLTAQTFAKSFLSAALADIARHSNWRSSSVYAAGWALFFAPLVAGSLLFHVIGREGWMGADLMVALFLLALSVVLLLDQTSFSRQRLFFDLAEEAEELSLDRSIDEACQNIARENNLSLREVEVLSMFVRGRTKPYIANSLFVSENTVKAHIKNIYTKMDVHSKQELLDMMYESMQTASVGKPGA